jgi:hypothetical protein
MNPDKSKAEKWKVHGWLVALAVIPVATLYVIFGDRLEALNKYIGFVFLTLGGLLSLVGPFARLTKTHNLCTASVMLGASLGLMGLGLILRGTAETGPATTLSEGTMLLGFALLLATALVAARSSRKSRAQSP